MDQTHQTEKKTPDEAVLWLEPDGKGGYVSDLSRLFGDRCRMGMTLSNKLVATIGTRIVAALSLDDDDRITAIDIYGATESMSEAELFRKTDTFMHRKVLYRQEPAVDGQ